MICAGGRRETEARRVGGKQSRWPLPPSSTCTVNYPLLFFSVYSMLILIGIGMDMSICRDYACGRHKQRKRKRQSIGLFPLS